MSLHNKGWFGGCQKWKSRNDRDLWADKILSIFWEGWGRWVSVGQATERRAQLFGPRPISRSVADASAGE